MDHDLIVSLLRVVEGTRQQPKLDAIYRAAMAELEEINQDIVDAAEPKPAPKPTPAAQIAEEHNNKVRRA